MLDVFSVALSLDDPLLLKALEFHYINGKNMKTIIALFLVIFSGSIYAEVPQEIQGIWVPDIEKTITLMEENKSELDSTFMREKYLPKLKRTISKNQYIHMTGKRELKADISLKEKQGSTFIMVLSNDSIQGLELTFIPIDNGRYIMQSQNSADGSGNIVWKKQ